MTSTFPRTQIQVTPPLDKGIILPGVTRRSIIELTTNWGEFRVEERKMTMSDLMEANQEGRLVEMFGAGTAAVVSPIGGIHYKVRERYSTCTHVYVRSDT